MTTNAELQNWGEPPLRPDEESLVELLATLVERQRRGEPVEVERLLQDRPELVPAGREMVEVVSWLQAFAASVLEHSSFQGPPLVAAATETEFPDPFPGEYRICALLGEGASGKVWLADDFGLGIPVALKALCPKGPPERTAAAVAALRQEARILATIRHPNIVGVYTL